MTSPELIDLATGTRKPICVECGETFVRSAAEVSGRRDPALPLSPRCPECRERRRAERNARRLAAYAQGPIGDRPRPAPGPDNGAGRLHSARCAACGRAIRLPFQPHADRPAYCRFCFEMRHGR